jgi:hypothetical protein
MASGAADAVVGNRWMAASAVGRLRWAPAHSVSPAWSGGITCRPAGSLAARARRVLAPSRRAEDLLLPQTVIPPGLYLLAMKIEKLNTYYYELKLWNVGFIANQAANRGGCRVPGLIRRPATCRAEARSATWGFSRCRSGRTGAIDSGLTLGRNDIHEMHAGDDASERRRRNVSAWV